MNPSREEDLFALALEKPDTERADFLDGACHGDPALRQRLKALPSAHDQPDELLGNGVAATTVKATIKLDLADEPVDEALGRTIGHYYPGLKGGLQRSQVLGYDNKYNAGWQASNDGLFSVVELVALRRIAPRPAAQRLPANRAVRATCSAAARGGVVAARQPLPLNRHLGCESKGVLALFARSATRQIRAKVTLYRRLSPTVFSQIAALIRPKRSS